MRVNQSIQSVFSDSIGGTGLDLKIHEAWLAKVSTCLDRLRGQNRDGSLPLLHVPAQVDDLAALKVKADQFTQNARDVVILGTGGSSLGGQALAQLCDYNIPGLGALNTRPRLHFFDNLDPDTFERFLDNVALDTCRFIVISKSGGTGETLVQTIAVLNALEQAGFKTRIGQMVLGLSEPQAAKPNALRALLEPHGVSFLEHHTGIGGRFSVLTNVGLLPAYLAGVNIDAVRQGAQQSLNANFEAVSVTDAPAAVGAALNVTAMQAGKNIAVMLGYADRFERFTAWWVQLWAESLGKEGQGSTPVRNIGPVDQHSQLQLHLAGPRDKLFTVLTLGVKGAGPLIDAAHSAQALLEGFGGRRIGDLVAAQGRATIDTLAKNGCPVRHIHIDKMDEITFGYLMMHFMLETILAADLMGIDAYDQPSVEEGKVLAKHYLMSAS
jgi:glucose-6-phosphate isomerase